MLRIGYRVRLCLCCSALIALGAAARAPSALAQARGQAASEQDAQARQLFENGRDAYSEARYDVALDYFKRAYLLSKRPQLLNNIGQAADRLRMDSEALDAYQRYLAEVPDAENRAAVENRIAALKSEIESKRVAVPTPAETARAAEPEPRQAAPAPATAPRDDDDDGDSVLSSWWLWAGIGAAAVAGVIVGVAASGGTDTVEGATPTVDGATRVVEL